MGIDVLILNTAVIDLRSKEFEFTERLVGPGGLAKCETKYMPDYSQQQYKDWIDKGLATAGGIGNAAPLIAKAGLRVTAGANLGMGEFAGLDAQGRYFYDVMTENSVDMSETYVHPNLPTGTTFIYDKAGDERGGIAYFPNANDDFDFELFKSSVERLTPKIVYYMYSGLSDRGDANGGKDLAKFIKSCRGRGIVSIVDSHTLTANPEELIRSGSSVNEYKLLVPLLPALDIFFTSSDEAKMIVNTLGKPQDWDQLGEDQSIRYCLNYLSDRFWSEDRKTKIFGITFSTGAYEKHILPDGTSFGPNRVDSIFIEDQVIDFVGAGDSFRSGLISYVAKNIDNFKCGQIDFPEAVQMGNLFASLFIKAPLHDRYSKIKSYKTMVKFLA